MRSVALRPMRPISHSRRGSTRRERGLSIIYVVMLLLILCFFVSIGVDMGRVRVAKSQLQTAADAAVLAGVQALPSADHDDAIDQAVEVAARNTVDGTAVTLWAGQDVEFGLYRVSTRTYTRVGDDEPGFSEVRPSAANAIKITAPRTAARGNPVNLLFARAVGRDTFDVVASATAVVTGGPTRFGIVGLDWVRANGNFAQIDSYDPSLGSYESQPRRHNGTVASNGNIDLGNGDVFGDARPGMTGELFQAPNSVVTGWTAPLDFPLVFPPPSIPAGTTNLGDYRPGKAAVLAGGTAENPTLYRASGFSTNKTLAITGAVEMYVTGDVDLRGASIVNSGLPANLKIFVVGSGFVDIGGNSKLYAQIYAPKSDITLHGTPGFYGALIGKTLDIRGTSDIHYDESVAPLNSPRRSMLIR